MASIAIGDLTPGMAIERLSSQITKIESFLKTSQNAKNNNAQILEQIDQISDKIEILHEKMESQDSLYYGLLKSILAEFNDHRQAFYLLLEANGVSCDDIKGWNVNNYEEEITNDNRKSKGNALKKRWQTYREKRKRGKKNV